MATGREGVGLMNGVTPKERRREPRAKIAPNEIAYLNFPSGNGGIVLDVSYSGLGFQAVGVLEATAPLAFRLSGTAIDNTELSGQIVWLDGTRKRGGLRLDVPLEARSTIRKWQTRHLPPAPSSRAPFSSAAFSSAPVSPARDVEPPPPPVRPSLGDRFPGADLRGSPPISRGPMFVSEWNYPAEDSHWGRRIVTALIVAILLAVVGAFFLGNRQEMGDLVVRLGESIAGEPPPTPVPAPMQNATSPAQNAAEQPPIESDSSAAAPAAPVNAPAAPGPSTSAVQNPQANSGQLPAPAPAQRSSSVDETPASPGASDANAATGAAPPEPEPSPQQAKSNPGAQTGPPSSEASASFGDGNDELQQARQYLQGTNRQDAAVAAQLLWTAVSKGNNQAELTLADLYLRGQGAVSKNCQQARILLRAARDKDVPGAAYTLGHIRDYGCR
jgi:hypothetical protein